MKEGDAWWVSNVGYSDFEIGKNKYKVIYTGGIDNEPATVMQYTHQRAKELCKAKGFDDFVATNAASSALVSGGGTGSRTVVTPHGSSTGVLVGGNSPNRTQTVYSMDVECKN